MTALANAVAEPIKITAYEKLRTDIAIAAEGAADKSFNYRDPKENRLCRSHLYTLRTLRGQIEGARKAAKATALEYGRKVDALAQEMEAQVDGLIKPHQVELEKIEAEERARIAAHQAVIDRLNLAQAYYLGRPSAEIAEALAKAKAIDTSAMEEMKPQGDAALFATIRVLEAELATATKRESEAAELARLRSEAAARVEAERIERIKREAAEAERTRADRERAEADAKAEAEKAKAAADAKAKIDAAKLAEEKAKRQAAEAKEREAKLKAELVAANERERLRLEAVAKAEAGARARQEAAEKAARDGRAAMVGQIAEDIARAGSTPHEIAEAIMAGMVRNVEVNWEG